MVCNGKQANQAKKVSLLIYAVTVLIRFCLNHERSLLLLLSKSWMINAEAFEWPKKIICARLFEVEKTFEEWIAVNWFQVGSFLLLKVKETFLLNNVKRNFLDDV